MSEVPENTGRGQTARPNALGQPTFQWTTTTSSITDTVRLVAGPFDVLPVLFVPGIMGSNLRSRDDHEPVWRLDTRLGQPLGLARRYIGANAAQRQRLLHPDRVEVDPAGAVPGRSDSSRASYRNRGWGTVAQGSYHEFLLWLEEQLNPAQRNPALWRDYYQDQQTVSAPPRPGDVPKLFPGIRMGMQGQPFGAEKRPFVSIMTDDLMARSKFYFPVYGCGYNWLASNADAAVALQQQIERIIRGHNNSAYRCQQVLLVTHSMGGLVSRACAGLPGMAAKIAGIVHGVMPAVGAAVAYRRCKMGMSEESAMAGMVIGSTGREVTAVFAQAPGALQLLPAQGYRPNWLRVMDNNNRTVETWPAGGDPFTSIYLRRDRWWGLVNEAWLAPTGGAPIAWAEFARNVRRAQSFHASIQGSYHPHTYAYYGADRRYASFETVTWRMRAGLAPDRTARPSVASVMAMGSGQLRSDGSNPEYVGGRTEVSPGFGPMAMPTTYETSYWELHCDMQDGVGDGTVPRSSGAAPLGSGGAHVQQQFGLSGFEHEPSYRNGTARRATLYSITKIAGIARRTT